MALKTEQTSGLLACIHKAAWTSSTQSCLGQKADRMTATARQLSVCMHARMHAREPHTPALQVCLPLVLLPTLLRLGVVLVQLGGRPRPRRPPTRPAAHCTQHKGRRNCGARSLQQVPGCLRQPTNMYVSFLNNRPAQQQHQQAAKPLPDFLHSLLHALTRQRLKRTRQDLQVCLQLVHLLAARRALLRVPRTQGGWR